MLPVPPTAGAVKVQPAGAVAATNVVPAGVGSVTVTVLAASGPGLLTTSVYAMSWFWPTAPGPFLTIERSCGSTVLLLVDTVSGVPVSVGLAIVAELLIVPGAGAPAATL